MVLFNGLPADSVLVQRLVYKPPREPETPDEIEAYLTQAGWGR
jgi:hypothetical protein